MDARLLEILVCPVCKGKLDYHSGEKELTCRACQLAYPVREGIPVMLADEARNLAESGTSSPAS